MAKKTVILYGNCHTAIVKKYLQACPEFNEIYTIYPIKEIQEVKDFSYFNLPIFSTCDVLIHQSIWEKNRYGKEYASSNIISKVKPDCKIIAMPNLYHLPLFLFPQYYEAEELRSKDQTYFFRDLIVDEGLRQGKTLKYITENYYKYKFDYGIIRNNYNDFLEEVKKREAEWDIKISEFINRNIRNEQLFYEPNHPTNFVIKYYAEELLKILLRDNYTVKDIGNYRMDSYEMPILGEVRNALDLSYGGENNELRITGVKVCSTCMSLNQYVKQYFSSIWMCNDFKRKLKFFSKALYYYYRIKNLPIRIYKKIVRIYKEERESSMK